MEHIANSTSEEINALKASKGSSAKKKTKKAKDTNQNINSDSCLDNVEVIKEFKENVDSQVNNRLVNGVSNDHDVEENHSSRDKCKGNEIVNKCERLICETETLVEKISKVNITDELSISGTAKCENASEETTASSNDLTNCPACEKNSCSSPDSISFESYKSELQMAEIMRLIQKDLSEPYSIYTYRYFIHNWPKLCFLAMHNSVCIGAIVCKLDLHRKVKRGYIAMLAVDEKFRKKKIGSHLVRQAITAMVADDADEVVLETEITNKPALRLYGNLGFVRDKRLFRYYLNGVDALRLKLWLK